MSGLSGVELGADRDDGQLALGVKIGHIIIIIKRSVLVAQVAGLLALRVQP